MVVAWGCRCSCCCVVVVVAVAVMIFLGGSHSVPLEREGWGHRGCLGGWGVGSWMRGVWSAECGVWTVGVSGAQGGRVWCGVGPGASRAPPCTPAPLFVHSHTPVLCCPPPPFPNARPNPIFAAPTGTSGSGEGQPPAGHGDQLPQTAARFPCGDGTSDGHGVPGGVS